MKKCFFRGAQVFEHEQGKPDANYDTSVASVRCMEEEAKTCNYPIMRHFFEQTEVIKKLVKQLETPKSEERQRYNYRAFKLPLS